MSKFSSYRDFLNEALEPSKFLTQEQIDWCNKYISGPWGVNSKGEVTVRGNLGFKDRSFERFPVQFAPVNGSFVCYSPKLVSLKGAPVRVRGTFDCRNCPNLVSLEGASEYVGRAFQCGHCPNLVSLKGAPSHVGGDFDCEGCDKLTSLEGAPAHVGSFDCFRCPKLTSLEGAPAHVEGGFYCFRCPKLPDYFEEIIDDYNKKRIDWKQAHKLIHSETGRKAHSIGLI